jgi:hypothetical protein
MILSLTIIAGSNLVSPKDPFAARVVIIVKAIVNILIIVFL